MTSQTLSLGAKLGSEGEFVRVLSDLLPKRWMGAMNAAASWNEVALLQSFFPGMKKALSKIFGGGDGEANADGAGKGPSGQGEKNSAGLGVRPLRVAKVVRETADAVSLYFEDPQGKPFQFLPGQFLTLTFKVDGELYRRAYSISSSSLDTGHAVTTTKRVAGGKVSNHINDHVREGDLVEALGPSGTFTVTPNAAAERHLVLLAGGSGITPMMSIARTVLQVEPKSHVTLLYGNRGEADIIFKDAIAKLAEQYGGRFHVEHVLANPSPSFKALAGMMNRDVVAQLVQAAAGRSSLERSYYICGPEGMMAEAKAALQALSVPAGSIHEERFSQPHLRPSERKMKAGGGPIAVTLRTKRGTKEVTVPADRSILEASLDAGVAMPYSCAMGGCGACRVKLVSGDMEMDEPNCLSPEERKEGYVLTCVGHPKTPVVLEVP